jgi:hypothetical protein
MNTTAKGDAFEDSVFDRVTEIFKELGFSFPKFGVFKKKGYFSKDRGSDIKFDVTIEVYGKNGVDLSLLIVVECKDYNNQIQVSELEEFYAKVAQVSGQNVKSIFVTKNAFQSGAFAFAESKGIALVRIMPDRQVHMVLYQSAVGSDGRERLDWSQHRPALSNQDYCSENGYDFAFRDGKSVWGFAKLIEKLIPGKKVSREE